MAGPKTLSEALRAAEYEIAHEAKVGNREYKRGKLDAIDTVQHILNAAIYQCRMLKQNTSQLEELRETIKAMREDIEGEILR